MGVALGQKRPFMACHANAMACAMQQVVAVSCITDEPVHRRIKVMHRGTGLAHLEGQGAGLHHHGVGVACGLWHLP